MKKIGFASIIHETCSFHGVKTTRGEFKANYFKPGAAVADHPGNITQKMIRAVDVMLAHETVPHDRPASGAKMARIMLETWENRRTP